MNAGIFQVSLFSLDKYLEVELLGQFLRNLQTAFRSGCTNLYARQRHAVIPFPPHPGQCSLFPGFFKNVFIYLAALGVSCGMWDLVC